jgi:methionine-rich copper-binding protein CopC/predicted nucleic acid-binding Zn ribbon protein
MKKFKLAFSACLLLILIQVNPNLAAAADLTSSSPASGASISSAPSVATITFSNSIGDVGNSVTVTAPNGDRVDDGSLQIADTQILVGLKPLSIGGDYAVEYEVVTTEGETLTGKYKFTFVAPAALASPTPESSESPAPDLNKETKSSRATDFFMMGLLALSILVLVLISRSLRKPKKKKRKK